MYKPKNRSYTVFNKGYPIYSAGFRDYEYKEIKPKGIYRIVVIGDSTTAGNSIQNLDKTYTKILEKLLNHNNNTNIHYEVLNMGVDGYHTMQEIETLRVKGLRFNPDLVLLTICTNDFYRHADGSVYRALCQKNPFFIQKTTELYNKLLRFSRLAFIVHHRLGLSGTENDDWYSKTVLKDNSTVKAGFLLLSELQQKHDFHALVTILPEFSAPFDKYKSGKIHERIFQAAEGLSGFEVIDLLKNFAEITNNSKKFSIDDIHMNENGHKAMAEILLPIIQTAVSTSK